MIKQLELICGPSQCRTYLLSFFSSPQAAVTCLAHLGSADVLESNSPTENELPNTTEAAAISKGTGAAAVGASTSNVAKTSKSGREAAAPPGPTRSNRPATGSSLELTPDAYHNLAESVRGKVSYEAAEKCYAAVEAACLAKNSKLMKGAMPDPVRVALVVDEVVARDGACCPPILVVRRDGPVWDVRTRPTISLISMESPSLTSLRALHLQVTVQDLYRAGAAVVGRSGNQTLNSLKILGLITVGALKFVVLVRSCNLVLVCQLR